MFNFIIRPRYRGNKVGVAMNIEELKKEYATQDNRLTAYPIYVTVQELVCIGVMADGYEVNCPCGDGEMHKIYRLNCMEGEYNSKEELINAYEEETEEKFNEADEEAIEELNCGYVWYPVEFFLTIKGAEEYMKANSHNHGKLRTYVHWFEDRNFEMRWLLKELGFRDK